MIKIVGLENIVDLIPFSSGILFVIKDGQLKGTSKVSFYSFDVKTKSIASVTKNAYLLTKFGASFHAVSSQLGDYISCDSVKLWNGNTFVIYSNGDTGLFSQDGRLLKTDQVTYELPSIRNREDMKYPARDCAAYNNEIWCVVPDMNCIVQYSLVKNRIKMRIGGDKSNTFDEPLAVCVYGDSLYVSNTGANNIKRVSLEDYSVEIYKQFDEPVYKYLRIEDKEFAVLDSGVYLL